jgi:23S rRNA (adenine2503-C2)-methyltransferase
MAVDFLTMNNVERRALLQSLGQAPFRVKQIEKWLYEFGVSNWEEMTNLPGALREALSKSGVDALTPRIISLRESGWASKYGIMLGDSQIVEAVAMRYRHGVSLCVSSQVGCRMGCAFCASTHEGLHRNMSSAEILSQVLLANRELRARGERVSHIVLMGMGEPLDNYQNVITFLRAVTEKVGLSSRRITLSTCGLVPEIYKLAAEELPITLSVSLHAPDDELRQQIMPISRAYPLNELVRAMQAYRQTTGRRVSVEYTLIEGVNDSDHCAVQLAHLLGREFHVNLIALNPVEGIAWKKPSGSRMEDFARICRERGLNVTLRRELGLDIEGSCGQLRRSMREH